MIANMIAPLAIVAALLNNKAEAKHHKGLGEVYPIIVTVDSIWPDWAVNNADADEGAEEYGATYRWGDLQELFDKNAKGAGYFNSDSKPTLTDQGVSFAQTILPPCTIDAAHYHPLGGEYMMTVQGATIYHWIDPVSKKYKSFLACASPDAHPDCPANSYLDMGLMHKGTIQWQSNPGCETTVFTSFFNADKPGRENILTLYLNSTDTDPLQKRASLGLDKRLMNEVQASVNMLPDPFFLELPEKDMKDCLRRCNIDF